MSQTLKVIGALTVACALLGSAGPASAKIAKNVAVSAETSTKVKRYSDGGAEFSGKVRFTGVKPTLGGQRVPKAMKGKARTACRKLYAGGETGGYEPWVWWKQRPRPGLALNAYASVTFKKTGKWFTGGLHPKDSHSPFTGQKIDVQGGFYDTPYHNNRREFMVKTFRFKGQARGAWCKRFDAVHKP